jgi:hypothetical protein
VDIVQADRGDDESLALELTRLDHLYFSLRLLELM